SPWRERRRDPSPDFSQSCRIDSHSDLFMEFARRAHPRIFIGIELPAGKREKATLKHHVRRAPRPTHLEFGSLADQDHGRCRSWTRHETQYILPETPRHHRRLEDV